MLMISSKDFATVRSYHLLFALLTLHKCSIRASIPVAFNALIRNASSELKEALRIQNNHKAANRKQSNLKKKSNSSSATAVTMSLRNEDTEDCIAASRRLPVQDLLPTAEQINERISRKTVLESSCSSTKASANESGSLVSMTY
jgi:hypothetical protein